MRTVLIASIVLCGVVVLAAQEPAQRFDFIALHRNTSGSPATSSFATAPNRRVMFNMGLGALVLLAYAQTPLSGPIQNAPAWLGEDRYDVVLGGPFLLLTSAQQQPLWRKLLADRLKLAAHSETRSEPAFDLVLTRADRALGPAFGTARTECRRESSPAQPRALPPGRNTPPRPPTVDEAMTHCGYAVIANTLYSGGITMELLGAALTGVVSRRVIDRTGVQGSYSVIIPDFSERSSDLMARLESKWGVKLVPSMTDVEVVVIDHIERPTDN